MNNLYGAWAAKIKMLTRQRTVTITKIEYLLETSIQKRDMKRREREQKRKATED